MPIYQRFRGLVGSVSSRSATRNDSASLPPTVAARAADFSSRSAAATEGAESNGNPHSALTSGLDDLALAQGQELLGPCRDCNGYWTRELARGQKPLSCPVCKRLGPPA